MTYAYATVVRSRDCWLLVIPRCPFCEKSHSHGGGPLDGDPGRYLSSRVSHCIRYHEMYWLIADAALQGQPVPESLYNDASVGMR